MRKFIRVTTMLMALCLFWMSVLPVSAETTAAAETTTAEEKTTVEEKTTAEEKITERETTPAEEKTTEEKTTEVPSTRKEPIYISFKNEDPMNPMPKYIYTGKEIKPQVVVTREDRSELDKSEYTLEYEGDFVNPGLHTIYAKYKKNGYRIGATFWIIPGTTDKINVKVKNGQVTVSWNPVPGANAYRVYKYDTIYIHNEKRTGYFEMLWPGEKFTSPKTSRTFTSEELKPGGKYKMAIMALPAENWMPTDQMAYFTVDTTKDTDTVQKPVTPEKTTLITPQPTKPGETLPEDVSTTQNEEAGTIAEENATAEIQSTVDTLSHAEADDENVSEEKAPIDRTKLIIIITVCLLAIVGIVFTVYKKNK